MAGVSMAGMGSGLDINGIIDSLIAVDSTQQNKIKNQVVIQQDKLSQYQKLNTQFSAIKTATGALNLPSSWKSFKATSSDATFATASATSAALPGTFSFSVKNLATAQTMASFGTVSSTSTNITGAGSMLLGKTGALGIGNLSGNLSAGAHTVAVTQASAGAAVNGAAVNNSVTFTGNETMQIDVDGSPKTITMQAGTYNQQQLASMLTTASGGALNVTVNSDKSLRMATTHEGSAATLAVTGGTALAQLGLSAGGPSTGTDGIVTVDGVATTVSDIQPNNANSVALSGGVTAKFAGGLRVGSASVNSLSTGTGSLSDVVTNINAANLGVTAAAVQVAPNQYKLQLQSNTTGSAGAIGMDLSQFAGSLGEMQTINPAKDATIQVGGANGYTVTSSNNTMSDVLPGVSINLLQADPNKTVTVSVAGDSEGMADKVKALVDAANSALSFIKSASTYNTTTKSAGALLGNSTASGLSSKLFSAISDTVQGSALGSAGNIGIKMSDDGTFTFDRTKFTDAYKADPEKVASMFIEGGSTGVTTQTKPGIAERLNSLTKLATDSVTGLITTAINGQNSTIKDLNKQIDNWTTRLDAKRAVLVRQFSAMDGSIASLTAKGNWLAGQLKSLG